MTAPGPSTSDILEHVLSAKLEAHRVSDLGDWWAQQRRRLPGWDHAIDAGIAGGFAAPCVAWAFAAGYHAATTVLFGTAALSALCVTEASGGHPRAIACRLEDTSRHDRFRLRGTKTMVTFGDRAEAMFVLAHRGHAEDGRKRFAMVRIAKGTAGVDYAPLPPFPFVPEVPHAAARIDASVAARDVLPGDGYERYVKPFRTVEDLRVQAAVTAYLVRLAREATAARPQIEQLVAHLATLRQLAASPPTSAGVHVALGGATARLEGLVDEVMGAIAHRLAPETKQAWDRDRRLLSIAERVRARRLEQAWATLDEGS